MSKSDQLALTHVYAHCALASHLVRTDHNNREMAEDGMVLDKMIVDKVLDSYARYCGFNGVVHMHRMLMPQPRINEFNHQSTIDFVDRRRS